MELIADNQTRLITLYEGDWRKLKEISLSYLVELNQQLVKLQSTPTTGTATEQSLRLSELRNRIRYIEISLKQGTK